MVDRLALLLVLVLQSATRLACLEGRQSSRQWLAPAAVRAQATRQVRCRRPCIRMRALTADWRSLAQRQLQLLLPALQLLHRAWRCSCRIGTPCPCSEASRKRQYQPSLDRRRPQVRARAQRARRRQQLSVVLPPPLRLPRQLPASPPAWAAGAPLQRAAAPAWAPQQPLQPLLLPRVLAWAQERVRAARRWRRCLSASHLPSAACPRCPPAAEPWALLWEQR